MLIWQSSQPVTQPMEELVPGEGIIGMSWSFLMAGRIDG
jgi:hypothetical protein